MTRLLPILMAVAVAPLSPVRALPAGAVPVQADDEDLDLPDGDLDLPDGDLDVPEEPPEEEPPAEEEPPPESEEPGAEEAPEPEEPGTGRVEPEVPEVVPHEGEAIPPPPEERQGAEPRRRPVTPESETGTVRGEPVQTREIEAAPLRRPLAPEGVEAGAGRVGRLDEEETPIVASPYFWGGVVGGVVLLGAVGAGVGYLVYDLTTRDRGAVEVVLQ